MRSFAIVLFALLFVGVSLPRTAPAQPAEITVEDCVAFEITGDHPLIARSIGDSGRIRYPPMAAARATMRTSKSSEFQLARLSGPLWQARQPSTHLSPRS